jgi:predicted aldo/keto reductase-like oxidoreductase
MEIRALGRSGLQVEVPPAAVQLGIGVIVMQPLRVGALAQRAPTAEALKPLKRAG